MKGTLVYQPKTEQKNPGSRMESKINTDRFFKYIFFLTFNAPSSAKGHPSAMAKHNARADDEDTKCSRMDQPDTQTSICLSRRRNGKGKSPFLKLTFPSTAQDESHIQNSPKKPTMGAKIWTRPFNIHKYSFWSLTSRQLHTITSG